MSDQSLEKVHFDFLPDSRSVASFGMPAILSFMIEHHIDQLDGNIPTYLGDAMGCKKCPVIIAGKECVMGTDHKPALGAEDLTTDDIPQDFRLMPTGTKLDLLTPCMNGFDLNVAPVLSADEDGVKAFQN